MVEEDEAWKTADPYAFLPDPQANTDVHEELTLSDGTVERFCNSPAQLKRHLSSTGGSVRPPATRVLHCSPQHGHTQSTPNHSTRMPVHSHPHTSRQHTRQAPGKAQQLRVIHPFATAPSVRHHVLRPPHQHPPGLGCTTGAGLTRCPGECRW